MSKPGRNAKLVKFDATRQAAGQLLSRRGVRAGKSSNRDAVTGYPDPGIAHLQSEDAVSALMVSEGIIANSAVLRTAIARSMVTPDGELGGVVVDATALMVAMCRETEAVRSGDMGTVEGMLVAQVSALNAIFTTYAVKAMNAKDMERLEAFMRLAFRAQSLSRAAIETIGELKNPPTVFAKQANISTNQQVNNNGDPAPPVVDSVTTIERHARTAAQALAPIKLLESTNDGQRLDESTTEATAQSDSSLATVEAIDGTAKRSRKSARVEKRIQRRGTAKAPRRTPPAARVARRIR